MDFISTWKAHLKELDNPLNVDRSSFKLHKNLQSDLWGGGDVLDSNIADVLYDIAKDFFDSLELEWIDIVDIIITGSLANYNWSEYSDIDLHILVDFNEIDENMELVQEYLTSERLRWNRDHDIRIKGFEVEIYVQDTNEEHVSTGVYSIVNDEWHTKPTRESVEIDWTTVEKKATTLMADIDSVYSLFEKEDYVDAEKSALKIKEKIRKFRRAGLDDEGQYSSENIAFKVLRRNGYLEKLSSLRIMSYDKKMSLKEE